MPIPQTKIELKQSVTEAYLKLRKDLVDIPEDLTILPELEGHVKGTQMSVSNLVSYLIGWGELVIKWHNKCVASEPIDFPDTGYNWNQLGDLAQKFYRDYAHLNYPTLLTKLEEVVVQVLRIIELSDHSRLYDMCWYKEHTVGRMIQLNTSSPYKNARTRVRKWKRERQV